MDIISDIKMFSSKHVSKPADGTHPGNYTPEVQTRSAKKVPNPSPVKT